jgi:dienelactone hydrolase
MAQTGRPDKRAAKKAVPAKKAAAKKASAKKAVAKKAAPAVESPTSVPVDVLAEPAVTMEYAPTSEQSPTRFIVPVIVVLLLLFAAMQLVKLGAEERGGPPHQGIYLGDGVPGTLYLPGEELDRDDIFPQPLPQGERPALIIMGHGYSSDQQGLSTMARSLARAGFATLTFDFRGHGLNRNRFEGNIDDDLRTVVDWAQTSPYVDPTKIVVLGHSMGAGAGLDFATLDNRIAAVIPVSGGDIANEVYTPPHVLLLRASGDPGFIKDSQDAVSKILEGRSGVEVKTVEITKTDHLSVVNDARTFNAISTFLDDAFGGAPAGRLSTGRDDPRRGTATSYVLVIVILIGFLGRIVGRAVRPLPNTTGPGAWLLLAGSVLIATPLLATGGFGVLPIGAGQAVAASSALAAFVLWTVRYFVRNGAITGTVARWIGDGDWMPLRSVGIPGLLAGLAIFAMLAPAGVVLHATVPNVERTIYWAILALALLPFFAAFEAIVRRGGTWAGLAFGLLGRAMLMVLLVVGLAAGVLPGVLGLILVPLVAQYLLLEVFAAAAWASGRNAAVIAVVDAIFVSWVAVMFSPIG